MAKPILALFSLVLPLFFLGVSLKMANAQRTWCVAKPSSSTTVLRGITDYACSQVNCDLLQQGGPCFYPYTIMHHASYAMDLYYQQMGGYNGSDCDFNNSGLISLTDPSYGDCNYGGATQEPNATNSWCVAKPSAENDVLLANINFVCNQMDCDSIQHSGACYNPTTLMNHASVVMNLYYQNMGRDCSTCDFGKSGLIVTTDPSYDNCMYQRY